VKVLVMTCRVTPGSIDVDAPLPMEL